MPPRPAAAPRKLIEAGCLGGDGRTRSRSGGPWASGADFANPLPFRTIPSSKSVTGLAISNRTSSGRVSLNGARCAGTESMDRPLIDSAALETPGAAGIDEMFLIGRGVARAGLPDDCDSRSRSEGRAGSPEICGDPLDRLPCRSSAGVVGADEDSMRESKLGFVADDTGGVARPRTDSSDAGAARRGSSNLRFPADVGSISSVGRAGNPEGLEGVLTLTPPTR
jgi:hypothetical protein